MEQIPAADLNRIHPYVVYVGRLHADNCPPAGTAFPPRTTKWYEIELIVGGQCKGGIRTSGIREDAVRGDILFRKPGTAVQGFAPYYSYFILFEMIADPGKAPSYGQQNVEQLYGDAAADAAEDDYGFPCRTAVGDCDKWERLCDGLHREFADSGGGNQFYLKTGVLQLLLLLRQTASPHAAKPFSPYREIVMEAKAWIDSDPSARLRLTDLARRAGMSRSLFGSHFAAVIGATPIAYVNQARLRLAKQLLVRTAMSVGEIANQCGFDNASYFFRLFRRSVGMTPLAYRDRFRLVLWEP